MSYLLALLLAVVQPVQTAPNLDALVNGVSRTLANMTDFSAEFMQISQDPVNRTAYDSGHVYLTKEPRQMRWDYRGPDGRGDERVYIYSGNTVFSYFPAERQASEEQLEEGIENRAPIGFLVGRARLEQEFEDFALLREAPIVAGHSVIRAVPIRKGEIEEVVMEVNPANYLIHRLVLKHSSGFRDEWIFSNIRTNTGLSPSIFEINVPPGVEVLNGFSQ